MSDNTRITINITTLILLIGSIIAGVFNVVQLKTDIDLSINSLEKNDIRIEQKFDEKVYDLEDVDDEIIMDQRNTNIIVLEIKSQLSGIQTDLKWIISNMENK